jgi:hypothetical protein
VSNSPTITRVLSVHHLLLILFSAQGSSRIETSSAICDCAAFSAAALGVNFIASVIGDGRRQSQRRKVDYAAEAIAPLEALTTPVYVPQGREIVAFAYSVI